MKTKVSNTPSDPLCSIERTVNIVGERWSFLVLREALLHDVTKYSDFEANLGIAPNILSNRLGNLVESGVLEKRSYKVDGSRPRSSYHPTPAGVGLTVALAALQQWGDEHVPPEGGISMLRQSKDGNRPVQVGFIDDEGHPLGLGDVAFIETSTVRS